MEERQLSWFLGKKKEWERERKAEIWRRMNLMPPPIEEDDDSLSMDGEMADYLYENEEGDWPM